MDRLILVSSKAILEANYNSNLNHYEKIFNGFPGNLFPVIIENSSPFQRMHWGYYHPKLKRSYLTAQVKDIIHDKRFQISIRTQKCLIPLNCFSLLFKGRRFLIFHEKARLFTVGGVYAEYKDSDLVRHRSFAILTVPASPFLKALGQYEEPLLIHKKDQIKWLGNDLSFASRIMNRNTDWIFNAFPISNLMDDIGNNTKEVLVPIGARLEGAVSNEYLENILHPYVPDYKRRKKVERTTSMEDRAKEQNIDKK